MTTRGSDIVSVIRRQIEEFQGELRMVDVGTVVEAGDGIARIQGLQGAQYSELLEFPEGVLGLALNLEEDTVGAAVMGGDDAVKEGDTVRSTGRIIEVPVGDELVGRGCGRVGEAAGRQGADSDDEDASHRADCAERGYSPVGGYAGADGNQGD